MPSGMLQDSDTFINLPVFTNIYIARLLIPMWNLLIWLKYARLQILLLFYYSVKINATACGKTNKHGWSLL